jgi:hypothetical protein
MVIVICFALCFLKFFGPPKIVNSPLGVQGVWVNGVIGSVFWYLCSWIPL